MADCILISRYLAKEALCSMCRWEGTSNCDECEHPIDGLPAIDPVKHGKWVSKNGWVSCSVCGLEPPNESNEISEYCPNCGARMDM